MRSKENYKIAAVVVTFNRLQLLKKCISALRNQTRKVDEIIVVNNTSTDGTLEWLFNQNDLTVITQENAGSAGGQYTGIKTAYEKGYDWIWSMDDDGYAKSDALEILLETQIENCVLNSLVLSSIDSSRTAFYLYDLDKKKSFNNYFELKKKEQIKGANFFNGTLLSRTIINKIGFPAAELFIRGDEQEYYCRLLERKIDIITITRSIFFHPEALYFSFNFLGKKIECQNLKGEKLFYYLRNNIILHKKYNYLTTKELIREIIIYLYIFSVAETSPKNFLVVLKSVVQGTRFKIFENFDN